MAFVHVVLRLNYDYKQFHTQLATPPVDISFIVWFNYLIAYDIRIELTVNRITLIKTHHQVAVCNRIKTE